MNGGAERFKGGHGRITYDAPWERDTFGKRYFKPALAAAGLPTRTRIHDLRHTYASIYASEGIPAYRIAKSMGHANEGITRMIYPRMFDEDVHSDMERLARPVATQRRATVTQLHTARR